MAIVVAITILAFFSDCIPALLKVVCSPLKKILAVNIRNLLLGMSGCILALLKVVCNPLKKILAVNIRNL